MSIVSLQINNFRNLTGVEISPCPGINIIAGANGSGKTSMLEAIHYLGLGRSFRTTTATRLVKYQTDKLNIFAEVLNFDQKVRVGLERNREGDSRLRVAEKEINTITELVRLLPVRIINSQAHLLIEGGPSVRRKYIDWGVFYHDESFLLIWKNFERALRQRNTLLKLKSRKDEINVWSEELIKYAYELHHLREKYIQVLKPNLQHLASNLLALPPIQVHYYPGWDELSNYRELLERFFWDEYRLGSTQNGPHRADLELRLNDVLMKHFFIQRPAKTLNLCYDNCPRNDFF